MKVRLLALAFGFSLVAAVAYAGPLPGGPDVDGDTVEDAFDNCTGPPGPDTINPAQTDTDHNGCGNACTCLGGVCGAASAPLTCDSDGDTAIGGLDFGALLAQWDCGTGGANPPCPPKPNMDCNGDTVVTGVDYGAFLSEWDNSAGTSGITSAQCNPLTCQCTPQ